MMNRLLQDDEKFAFDCYFASVCSMQMHPGAGTKEHRKLSLEECRDIAIDMVMLRRGLTEPVRDSAPIKLVRD